MKTVFEHIRGRLLGDNIFSYEKLKKSEWSNEFELLMRNRLIFGAYRYGKMRCKPDYDYIDSLLDRAKKYLKDGNQEYLVDIANFAMLEFVDGKHSNKHFKTIDDHNYHTRIKK